MILFAVQFGVLQGYWIQVESNYTCRGFTCNGFMCKDFSCKGLCVWILRVGSKGLHGNHDKHYLNLNLNRVRRKKPIWAIVLYHKI